MKAVRTIEPLGNELGRDLFFRVIAIRMVVFALLLSSCAPGRQYHEVGMIYPESLDEVFVRLTGAKFLSDRGYSRVKEKGEEYWVNAKYRLKLRIDPQFRSLTISNHQDYVGGHSEVYAEINAIRDNVRRLLYGVRDGEGEAFSRRHDGRSV